MRDEKLFELAIQMTIARVRAHHITPMVDGMEDWIDDQVMMHWAQFRKMWDENGIESGQS